MEKGRSSILCVPHFHVKLFTQCNLIKSSVHVTLDALIIMETENGAKSRRSEMYKIPCIGNDGVTVVSEGDNSRELRSLTSRKADVEFVPTRQEFTG